MPSNGARPCAKASASEEYPPPERAGAIHRMEGVGGMGVGGTGVGGAGVGGTSVGGTNIGGTSVGCESVDRTGVGFSRH